MKKVIKIENIDCANCASKIERNIAKLDGVQKVSVNFLTQKIVLETDDDSTETILSKLPDICKKVEPDCVLKI